MSYINKVTIGGNTHLIEPTLFAVAGGTSAAYTAAISNFDLVEGAVIHIKFVTTNSAAATLNVNSTGAKNMLYEGETLVAGVLVSNRIYSFVCTKDNDVWRWEMINDLPTDDKIEIVDMWGDS